MGFPSRSLLRALGSPFLSGFASQWGLRPSWGKGACGLNSESRAFPESAWRGVSGKCAALRLFPGYSCERRPGGWGAGAYLRRPFPCGTVQQPGKERAGKLRDPRTGRAGETQLFEVRLRGNAPASNHGLGVRYPHAPLPEWFRCVFPRPEAASALELALHLLLPGFSSRL